MLAKSLWQREAAQHMGHAVLCQSKLAKAKTDNEV